MYVPAGYSALLSRSSSSSNSSYEEGLAKIVETAWPSSIQLSANATVEGIINDIPFFSVGLLAFGVFTFFFVLRRLNMYTVYLHLAVILAFVGAVLDFSQILIRGETNVDANADVVAVWPLIVLSELSFSLSMGTRFLFFWSFVGEPPRGEALSPASDPKGLHGGRWEKDGLVGVIVKWLLLLGVLAVPVLQAVWRLIAQVHEFGPVYYTDSILEMSLSGLFIIKLVVNTFHTSLSPRLLVLRDYTPVILALLLSLGIGIGNLITFEFSESSLGRFLQAVEFYILILHVLVAAFYKRNVRNSIASWTSRPEPSQFESLSMPTTFEPGFRVSKFPTVLSGDEPAASDMNTNRSRPSMHRARGSSTSRLSAWISHRTSTQPPIMEEIDQVRLWSHDQAERGLSPLTEKVTRESIAESVGDADVEGPALTVEYPSRQRITLSQAMMPSGGSRTPSPVVMPVISRRPTPVDTQVPKPLSAPSPDAFSDEDAQGVSSSLSTMALSDFVHAKPSEQSMPTDSVIPASFTGTSIFQFYAESAEGTVPFVPDTRVVPDTPLYGLAGMATKSSGLDDNLLGVAPDTSANNSARSSGFDNLLRQQDELDKTIANLRLLNTRESSELVRSELGTEETVPGRPSHTSVSARSDLSLSHFPAPPTFATNSILMSSTTSEVRLRPQLPHLGTDSSSSEKRNTFGGDEILEEDNDAADITARLEPPPRMPAAMAESFPTAARDSTTSSQDIPAFRGVRFDSGGTQYDVTSFIGNSLPVVGEAPRSPAVSDKAWTTDDEESEDATIVTVARKTSSTRPTYIPRPLLATSGLPAFPKPVVESPTSMRGSPTALRPGRVAFAPSTGSPTSGIAGSPTTLRAGKVGLPARPRLGVQISSPMRQPGSESLSSAYERPRKAPSALGQEGSPRQY